MINSVLPIFLLAVGLYTAFVGMPALSRVGTAYFVINANNCLQNQRVSLATKLPPNIPVYCLLYSHQNCLYYS